MIAIAVLTVLCLSLALAMIAASLYLADVLERQAARETDLTPDQIAMINTLGDNRK